MGFLAITLCNIRLKFREGPVFASLRGVNLPAIGSRAIVSATTGHSPAASVIGEALAEIHSVTAYCKVEPMSTDLPRIARFLAAAIQWPSVIVWS